MIYASSAATYGSMPSPQTEGHENPLRIHMALVSLCNGSDC